MSRPKIFRKLHLPGIDPRSLCRRSETGIVDAKEWFLLSKEKKCQYCNSLRDEQLRTDYEDYAAEVAAGAHGLPPHHCC